MITVFNVLTQYYAENNLGIPSKNDLRSAGNIISHHFRRFWAPKQPADENGAIPGAGFLKSIEKGHELIVVGYPDNFKQDMIERIQYYLSIKAKVVDPVPAESGNINQPVSEKPKRKRIPAKPLPAQNRWK